MSDTYDTTDEQVPSWVMGALASSDGYSPGSGNDPWSNTMRPAWQPPAGTAFAPQPDPLDPRNPANAGAIGNSYDQVLSPLAANMAVPSSPLDYAMLASGGLGTVGKIGALASGIYGDLTDEAQAGKAGGGKKVMGEILDAVKNPRAVIGGNNPPPDARIFKYPQYADQYPPVGPPVLKTDKKKLEAGVEDPTYWGKQLTPDAKTFQKVRGKIIDDMDANGYTPYFNPVDRYHVDPTNYPPNVDTMTITPKKQATIDKYWTGTEAKPGLDSELVRQRLRDAYQKGSELPDTANWYAMGQLEKAFRDELGDVEGRKAFQDRFATSMAATTGGADPTANYLMAQYGNYLRANGLPMPDESHQYPFPVGGQYAGGNMAMFQKVMDAGGFAGLGEANPKRHNFAQNFTGNRGVATMDEQMTSGMTPGINEPGDKYGLYERVVREEAAKLGVEPQNFQDVAWAGFKNLKDPKYTAGKPMISHVNDAIERTHRLTGMPRDEIMKRGIIRSEIPIYALAAGAMAPGVMGALADQGRSDQ